MQSLKTRRLGQFQSSLVASPAYLAARGTPQTVKDLEDHACIVDTNRQSPRRWVFRRDGTEAMAQVQGRFHVNSARAAVELAQQGAGIAYVPDFALHCVAGSRDLVRLLADHTSDGHPITAAYLEGRTPPRKVRALIDFAVKDIKASGVVEMAL